MSFRRLFRGTCLALVTAAPMLLSSSTTLTSAQQSTGARQPVPQIGGDYASLDARRQRLMNDWVMRFNTVTKQKMQPDFFYDTYVRLSK